MYMPEDYMPQLSGHHILLLWDSQHATQQEVTLTQLDQSGAQFNRKTRGEMTS